MGVVFLCQPTEDRQWYYHWQKARLRWWKKVSFPHTYYTILSNRSIFQLAANPENFSLVETPTSELPGHTLKESFIKVSTRRPNLESQFFHSLAGCV